LTEISKIYPGDVRAVDRISLEIPNEQFVVLVGPSGCGKTTTLRMVAGLEDPTAGTIKIADRVVNHVAPKYRDIAMVFQSYALYPHMTVYKNLAFALKLRRVPRAEIERRVHWAAELLGLEPLLNRRPKALSGGQRQRVAVGRAIVRQPQVFLFDEPLSNLDAKLRVTTRAELKRLQQDLKTTTIYVTHDQEEAMTLGDKVVVMHQGKIQQCGTPLEIYRRPANRFVAGFVGMPPMNLLDGRLQRHAEGAVFESGTFRVELRGRQFSDACGNDGRPAVLGIRPESLRVLANGQAPQVSISGKILVVEVLGPTMDIYVKSESIPRLIARVETQDLQPGQDVHFSCPFDHVHLFHPDTADSPGARISC
jgi:multiple sugar transport system ATP-binding protein